MLIKNRKPKPLDKTKGQVIDNEKKSSISLSGPLGVVQRVIMCLIPIIGVFFILNVHMYLGWYFYTEQYVGVIITLILAATFLSTPVSKHSQRKHLPWYDMILALLALPAGLYLTWQYPNIAVKLGEITPERVVIGMIMILLVLEAMRRVAGWVLVIVVGVFILYGRFGYFLPGALQGLPMSWEKLVVYLYVDPNSMLNLITLAAGIALAFILFGQVMIMFGGGKHLNDVALLALGRFRGGAAKSAILGTSLIGTLTGGAVPTALLSGSVTIPMMLRSGYSPSMAGAIVSVSASGSNIMPPVMGVVAFLMAEYLGVSYADVVIAAIVPALLFYIVCFLQVDLEAAKLGIRGLPKSELPTKEVLREAWVVAPCLVILVYVLIILRLSATTAGVISAITALPLLMIVKTGRGNFKKRILDSLETTGGLMVNLGAIIAGAGIIVGIANVSGFGFNVAYALVSVGQNNLLLLLLLAAIASIILGMGMPSVPAYALVATLVAPALEQLGVTPMAAHLFIFYFSMVSNWTPPVAFACFAVSTISGDNPFRTGFVSMRLGLLAYILPFLFVYSPALLLIGDNLSIIILSISTAIVGTIILAVGLIGYLFRNVPIVRRVLFCIAGCFLLFPIVESTALHCILVNVVGLILAVLLTLWELHSYRSTTMSFSKEHIAVEKQ